MAGMPGMSSGPSDVAFRATRPQIASIAFMSVVALAGALVFSASYANLSLGATTSAGW